MNKLTITFADCDAVTLAKLERLAEEAKMTLEAYVARFLERLVNEASYRAEKGIRYPNDGKSAS